MDNEVYFMVDNMCCGVVDETNSAVIYAVYFSVTWSMTRAYKYCNLRRLFFRDMVDDTSIYGSAVIFAVYFTVAWSIVGINSISFPISFVIVCARLMTRIYVGDSLVWGSLRLTPIISKCLTKYEFVWIANTVHYFINALQHKC